MAKNETTLWRWGKWSLRREDFCGGGTLKLVERGRKLRTLMELNVSYVPDEKVVREFLERCRVRVSPYGDDLTSVDWRADKIEEVTGK